jgi:hypothetical protein
MPQSEGKSPDSKEEASRRRRRARAPETANTIRPSPAVVSWIHRAVSRLTAERRPPYDAPIEDPARPVAPVSVHKSTTPGSRSNAVPEEVHARFVRVGRDFHFQTGARAFRDHGHKIVTHTENSAVVRALVAIAVERGWNDITVSGTARFRRDAWRVATVSGLAVRGYRATEFEKQKLARDLAAARQPVRRPEPLIDFPQRPRSPSSDAAQPALSTQPRTSPPQRGAGQSASKVGGSGQRERSYSGTLIDHGPAPYEFHPQGEPSYFLQIQTRRGPTVLWGKDLERAVNDAKVTSGVEIHVRQAGRDTVTVRRKERDEDGRVVKEHNMKTHRNQWEVSRNEHAKPRSEERDIARTMRSSQAANGSAHAPANVDSAVRALKAAQLFANERIKEPAQRSAFVNAVREELARAFERGGGEGGARLRATERERAPSQARTVS